MPNRHQATDFYQIKIELYKQIRYCTNVTGFGGVFQVIDMSAQFSWRRCYFINARISKLESNCDEANGQHLLNNGRYHTVAVRVARTNNDSKSTNKQIRLSVLLIHKHLHM